MASLNPLSGTMDNRKAAHLLRRCTFGPTRSLIETYAAKTVAQAVSDILQVQPVTSKPIDYLTGTTWVDNFRTASNSDQSLLQPFVVSWWLDNARRDNTILHKMIVFLHQYWVTGFENVNSEPYYDYLKLLEYYALGSYKTLAYKMSLNNSMLIYLDGTYSTGSAPNENYAREFLELFTIGKGPQIAPGDYTNYTETDIKEAAKVFTGYQYQMNNSFIDPDTGIRAAKITPSRHKTGNKTFSAAFQNTVITAPTTAGATTETTIRTELQDLINMVFNQIATAKSICRRLYRFFIHPQISAEAETDIITPLATQLKANNYDLRSTLQTLLQSEHFYDMDDASATDETIGAKLKSPADLLLGTMRFFNIQPPDATTATQSHYQYFYRDSIQNFFLVNTGMEIFRPVNVAGYKAYYQEPDYDRLWLNSSSIVTRYTLGRMFLENKRILTGGNFYASFDILTWVKNTANISDPGDGTKLVDEMTRYLFPENPFGADRFNYFLNDVLLGTLSLINWRNEWNNYISSNNSASVLPRLQKLFKAILFSQEYQLH